MCNVFHAGDGNLHPLLVFDAREPGVLERVHAAGAEIVAGVPRRRRACCRASTASASRSATSWRWQFDDDDLDAQARLRRAFDPDGVANPHKVLPAGSGCADLQALPKGVWV